LKNDKRNNLLKTKRIIKIKYELMGRPIFACSLPGGAIRPSSAAQKYQHGSKMVDRLAARSNNIIFAEFD